MFTELRIIAAGAGRVLLWWPGIVVVLAVYVVVAVGLYHHLYPNLWAASPPPSPRWCGTAPR